MSRTISNIARYLFFLTAIILVVLAAGSFMRVNENPNLMIAYAVYGVLMFGDAIAMLVCGLYINKKMNLVFWFAVILLSLNIILTLFDQFGLVDLLFSLLNLITLTPLLLFRKEFLPQ
jgi:lysylphosphatidylglycerol synthetase-like protein (DUF2156 family)